MLGSVKLTSICVEETALVLNELNGKHEGGGLHDNLYSKGVPTIEPSERI